MNSATYDELLNRAEELGIEHGRNAGSWIIDGNTSAETARAIIKGYDDGDSVIMDIEPSPLSGEWGDDPTVSSVLSALGFDIDAHEGKDGLLDQYEVGFGIGFWDEVIRSANAIL
jgi:hypothetical protein